MTEEKTPQRKVPEWLKRRRSRGAAGHKMDFDTTGEQRARDAVDVTPSKETSDNGSNDA